MATYLQYLNAAMHRAQYERTEDGEVFASIPGLVGLWATGASVEEARQQLHETLDEWIRVHTSVGKNRLPDIGDVSPYAPVEKVKST